MRCSLMNVVSMAAAELLENGAECPDPALAARGSAPGSVPCPVRRHLCAVLGVRCALGNRTPAPALGAPRSEPGYPPALGLVHASTSATCSAPCAQSSRSTSQFVR